jgi:hypothetical protein
LADVKKAKTPVIQAQPTPSLPECRITVMSQMHLSAAGQVLGWEATSSLQRAREGEAGAPTGLDVKMKTSILNETG